VAWLNEGNKVRLYHTAYNKNKVSKKILMPSDISDRARGIALSQEQFHLSPPIFPCHRTGIIKAEGTNHQASNPMTRKQPLILGLSLLIPHPSDIEIHGPTPTHGSIGRIQVIKE
jgi:hypothetical protein